MKITGYEVRLVGCNEKGECQRISDIEVLRNYLFSGTPPFDETFWTVYANLENGMQVAMIDRAKRSDAMLLYHIFNEALSVRTGDGKE